MYIPQNFHLETEHLDTLLKQLPSSYILVGDFNGDNILWGCKDNNPKGNIIEDFITKNDLCLMNDKSHTHLHPATGKFSSLDLSMCHPSLLLDFDWTVSENQHGSDHFPVIFESVNNSTNDHNAKWKLNKANWELYHSLCLYDQEQGVPQGAILSTTLFNVKLNDIIYKLSGLQNRWFFVR